MFYGTFEGENVRNVPDIRRKTVPLPWSGDRKCSVIKLRPRTRDLVLVCSGGTKPAMTRKCQDRCCYVCDVDWTCTIVDGVQFKTNAIGDWQPVQ